MKDNFEHVLVKMAQNEKLSIPQILDDRIDTILDNLPKKRFVKKVSLKAVLVIAAAFSLVFSTAAIAAVSLVQQRMESMNKEKLEEYFNDIQTSKTSADYKNREYSETEKIKFEALKDSYEKEGLFPKGEITLLDNIKDYKGKGVAFFPKKSTFFFPDREMTEEEILQIIDFYAKRDYSLAQINAMIDSGEMEMPEAEKEVIVPTDDAVLSSDTIYNPTQELVVPYTGNLEIGTMQAGIKDIFLAGFDGIHKMQVGSGDSELFFNDFGDFNIQVDCMVQADDGILYAGIRKGDSDYNQLSVEVWAIDTNGAVISKIDVTEYIKGISNPDLDYMGLIKHIAIDGEGYLYLRTSGEVIAIVIDTKGNLVSYVKDDRFVSHLGAGIGIGKDGKAYTFICDYGDDNSENETAGIASIDPKSGKLEQIYTGIVPVFPLDIITKGQDTDFILWGFKGIFTYNLGDKEAKLILPPYEAPCEWEGCLDTVLPDGRLVFGKTTDYREITIGTENTKAWRRVPEATTFYYTPTQTK